MTDHWNLRQPGNGLYWASDVDAARAKDAEAHAAALAAKDAEIACLRAQVEEDARLRSVVVRYSAEDTRG